MDVIFIVLIVGVAAIYLFRRFSRAIHTERPTCGCGGCDGCCGSSNADEGKPGSGTDE